MTIGGIAFVTRIVPDLAVRQVIWLFAAVAVMVAVLALVRNLDKLANYKYTLMIVGILLLLSPMLPVIGEESGGGQLWLPAALGRREGIEPDAHTGLHVASAEPADVVASHRHVGPRLCRRGAGEGPRPGPRGALPPRR